MSVKVAILIASAMGAALGCWGSGAYGEPAPAGKIRLCREPHVVELMDRRSVRIPKGTGFSNGNDRDGAELKPYFAAHTTHDQILPPKPGCVTLDAVLDDNPEGFRLTTHYPAPLPTDLNVAGLSVLGRVVADFK